MAASATKINGAAETTLVDYFVVAGYDPEIGLVVDLNAQEPSIDFGHTNGDVPSSSLASPEPLLRTPLQRAYLAKINFRFPQRRLNSPFREEILSLCMPKGLRFYTERDVPCEPSFHTFANILEDGTRINGTAITFYEEVHDYAIKEKMSQLHTQHVRELTAMNRESTGGVEHRERAHLPPGTISGGTHTLPRGRRSATKRISYYGGAGDHNTLYMSRTLCLITRLPIVCATTTILRALHQLLSSSQQPPPLPLECYIYWFLNEIPMPSPGTTLKVPLLDQCLIVQRPGTQELPFFDDAISRIFEFMSVEKFITLLSCFLLENQILLCSKHLNRLMLVCESLCSLAFPFRWQLVYVPILPFAQLKFVEAPVPYVMGWCYEEAVPESIYQSNVCVIDLDIGRAQFSEDMPVFPDFKKLCKEIRMILERYSNVFDSIGNGATSESANPMLASTMTMTSEDVSIRSSRPTNLNTYSVKPRSDEWNSKRMSRSFDLDDGIAAIDAMLKQANGGDFEDSTNETRKQPHQNSVVKSSDAVARAAEIARRMGIDVNIDNIEREIEQCDSETTRKYFQEAKINNAIRECILTRLVEIFFSYEHFVVGGTECKDRETFEANRESMACFDKASFLSDQPDSHLTFLSHFLETQMFTSFIDSKILSQWESQPDENVKLFDERIDQMRRKMSHHMGTSIVRTPTCETAPSPSTFESEAFISKRETTADYVVPKPHPIDGAIPIRCDGSWPMHLNTMILEGNNFASPAPSPWKQRYPRLRPKSHATESGATRPTSTYGGPTAMPSDPQAIALQQYNFVQQLLRETKTKTKRMLVDKMGKEAVQLGHLDAGITGVEENTLVASFCDLLERIWAHGLKNKQGKSALWSFVLQHQDLEKPTGLTHRTNSTSMLSPGQRAQMLATASSRSSQHERAPSLPPQDLPFHAAGRPQDSMEVPPPIILSPNENDFATVLSDLVETIQKELSLAAKDVVTAAREVGKEIKNTAPENNESEQGARSQPNHQQQPAWSQSIMKAANFISSKISSGTDKVAPPPTQNPAQIEKLNQKPPHHPVRRYGGALSATNILSGTSRYPQDEIERERRQPRGMPPKMQPYPGANINTANQQIAQQQSPQQNLDEERGRSLNRAITGFIKKSSSMADFTNPNWSMGSQTGGNTSGNGNGSVTNSPRHRSQSRGRARSPDGARVVLGPLPTALAYDLKNVLRMTEIKTDIGYARAFVRLALERKLLHKHLQTLLGNQRLISELYKPYAFVGCEDEREQFLYHILSLNAAQFRCFTNTFTKTKMDYQVVIVTGSWRGTLPAIWITVEGNLCNTPAIKLPPNTPLFKFDHKNLGLLSSLRIGHVEKEKPQKWFLDYILIRNEITGQCYKFPCGKNFGEDRWFGKGSDDSTLERLLVAEPQTEDDYEATAMPTSPRRSSRSQTPQRERSPSSGRQEAQVVHRRARISDIQQELGEAVNKIVKYFCEAADRRSKAELTHLLCGRTGLVPTMEAVFQFGRQESIWTGRLFRQNSPWDYIEKVFRWYYELCRNGEVNKMPKTNRDIIRYGLRLVKKIQEPANLGKDCRFHVFILLSLRDRVLPGLLQLISLCPITEQLYNEPSFLRSPTYLNSTCRLLENLHEFEFVLDSTLTYHIT